MLRLDDSNLAPAETWRQLFTRLRDDPAYQLIREQYRGRTARRSGLPYINHIHEGVYIYARLFGWEAHPIAAYCVHPVFQGDDLLRDAAGGAIDITGLEPGVVLLAMEYRRVANAYISTMPVRPADAIELSPLDEVNRMLVADKVQNRKDFVTWTFDQVEDSHRLTAYFDSWLSRLAVSSELYDRLVSELDEVFGGAA